MFVLGRTMLGLAPWTWYCRRWVRILLGKPGYRWVYIIYIYIYVIFIDVDHLSYQFWHHSMHIYLNGLCPTTCHVFIINELSPQAPINSEARPNQTAQNHSLAASFGEPCEKPAPAYHALSPIVDDAQPTQDAKRDVWNIIIPWIQFLGQGHERGSQVILDPME